MTKKEIKSILENMGSGEEVNFFGSGWQGRRTDRVRKMTKGGFTIFSSCQGWCDQAPEDFDFKSTLKIIWSNKPHEALDA